jgi:hypothetical protein
MCCSAVPKYPYWCVCVFLCTSFVGTVADRDTRRTDGHSNDQGPHCQPKPCLGRRQKTSLGLRSCDFKFQTKNSDELFSALEIAVILDVKTVGWMEGY